MGSNLLVPILRQLAPRQTLAAPKLSTSSPESSTMASSTRAFLHPLAFPRHALSAMRPQASTAPRIAKPTVFLAGASLVACPALCPHRRPSPPALVSQLQPLILVNRKLAFPRHALSAMRPQASTAPQMI